MKKIHFPVLVSLFFIFFSSIIFAQPTSFKLMNERIEENAKNMGSLGGLGLKPERGVFFDSCLPADSAEYQALNGLGVILFSVVTRDKSELPIKTAYYEHGGKKIALKFYNRIYSNYEKTSIVADVYGIYRVDEIFLVPLVEVKKIVSVHVVALPHDQIFA